MVLNASQFAVCDTILHAFAIIFNTLMILNYFLNVDINSMKHGTHTTKYETRSHTVYARLFRLTRMIYQIGIRQRQKRASE